MTIFDQSYNKLNPEQKLAVDTLEGPVLVVAGPGTGKTQTLAMRIANILKKTDTDPSSILALTFTEAGTKAMKSRLRSLIGTPAYYVNITTFHGFCASVIRENPDLFPISHDKEPIAGLRQNKLIEEILASTELNFLRPLGAPGFYVQSVIKALSDLKREGYTPDSFRKLLTQKIKSFQEDIVGLSKAQRLKAEKDLQKNQELATLFVQYESTLRKHGDYDFDDMVSFVANAFDVDENLLLTYQERYQYFLVDEYQDTNTVQNNVVDSLVSYWGEQGNIFVVGDPDQCIMRFQGASMENILGFQRSYPKCKTITLEQNYRSTQLILDAAHSLIVNNHNPISSHLTATNKTKGNLVHIACNNSQQELSYIGANISKLLKNNVDPSEIAVIYRNNHDAEALGSSLEGLNIAYRIQGGGNILDDPWIKQLRKLLGLVVKLRTNLDDIDLFTVLLYPYIGAGELDVMRLARYASSHKLTIWEVLIDDDYLSEAKVTHTEKLQSFRSMLLRWQSLDATRTVSELIIAILHESGLQNYILERGDYHLILGRMNAFFAEIQNMNSVDHDLTAQGLVADLALMDAQHLKIKDLAKDEIANAVTLTTAHSAKGLEWSHVFIYKCIDGAWGNNRKFNLISLPSGIIHNQDLATKEKNEDERRLLYVALTRAKTNCTITSSSTYRQGGTIKEAIPSMFLSEMGLAGSVLEKGTVPDRNAWVQPKQGSAADEGTVPDVTHDESLFLSSIIKDLRLSPTSLNTYLQCAYKFKLNNLVAVPRARATYLSLGTAVHAALEWMYQSLNKKKILPTLDSILEAFDTTLKKEVMSKSDYQSFGHKGQKMLSAYYAFYKEGIVPAFFMEKYFGYGQNKIILDADIELVGKVDRIDLLDSDARTIRVVDYKTGKPKTRGQIEGKTKDSEGAYYRQLVFYKLLVELDKSFKFDVAETQLDFVEPDEKGEFKRYSFTITKEDVESLKDVIRTVTKSIRNLEFPRTTNYKTCESCEFLNHCFPGGLPQ
jgi:DNA helicase-2/ATP-dependent DNA helicase PcrA